VRSLYRHVCRQLPGLGVRSRLRYVSTWLFARQSKIDRIAEHGAVGAIEPARCNATWWPDACIDDVAAWQTRPTRGKALPINPATTEQLLESSCFYISGTYFIILIPGGNSIAALIEN
jgi:hypothetical protein